MGDFNAVLTSNEKTGRVPALQACLALSNFVQQSALHEVSCPDMKFTWTNNRVGHENIMSKIDRCYVFKEWVDDPDNLVHLEVLPRTTSDHNPILLRISKCRFRTWGRSPFRHFQYWQDMVGYVDQVRSAWTVDVGGCTMIKLIHKLEATRDKLKAWCKGGANDLPYQIRVIERKIKHLQVISESGQLEAIDEECYLKHDLSRLLWLEERRWRQKSRIKWMKDGDLNTKFFQGVANGRRRQNKIETLQHEGQLLTDNPEIFTACTDYFARLLGTSEGTGCLPQSLAWGPTVSPKENVDLLKPVLDSEITWAVMKADKDSASGPNGFGNSFFQSNWHIVREVVSGAIRGFFDSGRLVKSVNKTHITLLPKEPSANQVEKLRPISLCNSILKFITRIIVLRMWPILNRIISKNQNAFLPGRCIQDSFLLSQEIEFLKATLLHLGFHEMWVQKIMTLVTTVTSSLLINGKEGMWFDNKRDLRQGDPLSPYLFISVMEMLSRSVQAYINNNQIRIPSMGAGSTSPFSTLYADDIMFFIEGRRKNLRYLKLCLDNFFRCSGLAMNIFKSSLFPFNIDSRELNWIEQEIGCRQGKLPSMYLGIPLQTKDVTEEQCRHLILRSSQKLALWKKRCLSAAGRLSLIKHALSLLPSYWSLVVKLPVTICNQLNKMAAEFLWGDMADHKSVHHIKWSTLCLPLLEGGVGLRDIRETNLANMAYLVYRASLQSSPWAVLIKGRYCERKGFLASSVSGKRVSNVWHRALQCWRKVIENVGWKIGNGELAKFWTDHWGADHLMDKIPASHFHLIQDTITCSVKELLEENGEAVVDYLAKLNIFFPCPPIQVDQPDVMWNDQRSKNIRSWIRSGILWSNGVRFEDKWVEISITSWYKQGRKGVAGFIRDGPGQVRFGVACWFELSPGWPETQILNECLGHLVNVADNMGHICLLANDGDWKNYILSHRGCRLDLFGNRVLSNSYIDIIKVCKGWPLVEGVNLLMITLDNGLYTTWNPQESL
ncbi:retrotransposable element ORF2 protein [Nymphaea thermarum]|nr:retrotransposable element ORF2 protein [Nymphaea thermarum]